MRPLPRPLTPYTRRPTLRTGVLRAVTALAIGLVAPLGVCAQVTPPSGAGGAELGLPRPGDVRPGLPEFPAEQIAPGFVLPPVPAPSPDSPALSSQLRVRVTEIRVVGNTVLSEDTLKAAIAPYVGREVGTDELQALRRELTLLYINQGYINSGVVIPDQKVDQGVVTFQVIEGVLSEIDVIEIGRLDPDYVSERIALGSGPPLDVNALQQRLQLLHQNPLIERLTSELVPGVRPGESRLKVAVEEARPYQVVFSIDNHRAPSIGAVQGQVQASHWNVTGRGDTVDLHYARTQGLDDFGAAYFLPVSAYDTKFGLEVQRSDSSVVEQPFNAIDIESESRGVAISLSHPFINTPSRSLRGTIKLDNRRSKTFLLGRPFSFSPGVRNGKSEVTVFRFSADWVDRRQDQVTAVRSTLNLGVDLLGATQNASGPDGRFFSWLGQFQWARRFGDNENQLIFRTDVQLSADALLPLEKFAVGGASSVRGYRENQLVRDNGLVSSLELRVPVLHDDSGVSRLQLAAFLDYGRSWNKNAATPAPRVLASAGIGLRWNPLPKLFAQIYAAVPFRNIDNNDHDLQDEGIHFALSYRMF